jgi:ankyrin repeat protein
MEDLGLADVDLSLGLTAEFGGLFAELQELQRLQELNLEELMLTGDHSQGHTHTHPHAHAHTHSHHALGQGPPGLGLDLLGELDGTPRPPREHAPAPPRAPRAKVCEAKLYVGFQALPSPERLRKHGPGAVTCAVAFHGNTESCVIEFGKGKGPGQKPAAFTELVFDVHEYYGLSKVDCAFSAARLLGRPRALGRDAVSLRDLLALQARPGPRSPHFLARALPVATKLFPTSDSTVYWGFERRVRIADPASGGPLEVLMYGRYVSLRACLQRGPLGGILQTELHLAASRAPQAVLEDLLAALSREALLPACLRVRCRRAKEGEGGGPGEAGGEGGGDTPGACRVCPSLGPASPPSKALETQELSVTEEVDSAPDTRGLRLTPLEAALQSGHAAAAKALLQRAGNFCFENIPAGQRANTPIHSAVRGGADCLRLVMRFLSLHAARQSWAAGLGEMLESRDGAGRTPLMLAALLGRALLVGQFMKMGVDMACASGDRPYFRTISRYGDIVIASTSTYTPAPRPAPAPSEGEGEEGRRGGPRGGGSGGSLALSLLDRMLARAARPRAPSPAAAPDDQWTALMYAAAAGHTEVVRLLLAPAPGPAPGLGDPPGACISRSAVSLMRCAPCARSREGRTALMLAAERGHAAAAEALVLAGLPLRSLSAVEGDTALHVAAAAGRAGVAELILCAEAALWGVQWGPPPLWARLRRQFEAVLDRSELVYPPAQPPSPAAAASPSPRAGRRAKDIGGGGSSSLLQHMQPRFKLIRALNHRGQDAAAGARRAGHADLAGLLEGAARHIYGGGGGGGEGAAPTPPTTAYTHTYPDYDYDYTYSTNASDARDAGDEGSIIHSIGGPAPAKVGGGGAGEAAEALLAEEQEQEEEEEEEEDPADRDASEHAAYVFALAAVPRRAPCPVSARGFAHMDLDAPRELAEAEGEGEADSDVDADATSDAAVALSSVATATAAAAAAAATASAATAAAAAAATAAAATAAAATASTAAAAATAATAAAATAATATAATAATTASATTFHVAVAGGGGAADADASAASGADVAVSPAAAAAAADDDDTNAETVPY